MSDNIFTIAVLKAKEGRLDDQGCSMLEALVCQHPIEAQRIVV